MLDRDSIGYPQAVLVVLLVATLVGIGVAASTSTGSFSLYNARWDGGSDLEAVADAPGRTVEVLRSPEGYADGRANRTVAVVLSPTDPYTDADTRAVRAFVREGGTLVVADDYGAGGNRLLSGIGARARIDGRPLRDERVSTRSPAFPIARNVSTHRLTAGVDRLVLNHASPVTPNGATVLVRTSAYAYPDANGNGALDPEETMRSVPVATVEPVGEGRVIVIGDPSLFINAMLDRPGNRRFAENLLREPQVLLDYSHAGGLPPLPALRLHLQHSPLLQGVVGLVGLTLVVAWGRGGSAGDDGVLHWLNARLSGGIRDADERVVVDPDAIRTALETRHPDWDEDRLHRVTQGIIARRDKWQTDD